jgi:hypothetical protein
MEVTIVVVTQNPLNNQTLTIDWNEKKQIRIPLRQIQGIVVLITFYTTLKQPLVALDPTQIATIEDKNCYNFTLINQDKFISDAQLIDSLDHHCFPHKTQVILIRSSRKHKNLPIILEQTIDWEEQIENAFFNPHAHNPYI